MYSQLRVDYAFNANLSGALEAVHYAVGDTIRPPAGMTATISVWN